MAFPVVLKTYVEKIKLMTDRFTKAHAGLVYNDDISLSQLIAKALKYEASIDARNAAAIAFSNSIDTMNQEEAELSKMESAFLMLTGIRFTKDSDEYVWAGGIRQSDANEKRKMTVIENQRLERLRVEAEADQAKAEKERLEAEMVSLKAEVERLRTEKMAYS